MNWTFIVIGNLLMDTAIAIFALLLGLRERYKESYETTDGVHTNLEASWNKILLYCDKKTDLNDKDKQIQTLMPEILEKTKKLKENYSNQVDKRDPFVGYKFTIIKILFATGIILQVIGIIFTDVINIISQLIT